MSGQALFSVIILAGGLGTRMGGQDKGLILYKQQPLIWHVLQAAQQFSNDLVISANRNLTNYQKWGWPVYSDDTTDFLGPLAGIHACILHSKHDWIIVLACDIPHINAKIAKYFTAAIDYNPSSFAFVVHDGQYQQNLCLCIHRSLAPSLQTVLKDKQLSVHHWLNYINATTITVKQPQWFTNVNHIK